jgi:hypothetical protein
MKILFNKEQWKEGLSLYNFKLLLKGVSDEEGGVHLIALFVTFLLYIVFLVLSPLMIFFILLLSIKIEMESLK